MKIKTLTGFSGPAGSFAPHHEYDVPAEMGREWVSAGLAEEVKPAKSKVAPLREPTELQPATTKKRKRSSPRAR